MSFTKKRFKGKPVCTKCRYFIFSVTLSSEVPIWHCRFGFTPMRKKLSSSVIPFIYDCRDNAKYNVDLMNSSVQLSLNL